MMTDQNSSLVFKSAGEDEPYTPSHNLSVSVAYPLLFYWHNPAETFCDWTVLAFMIL